MAQGMTVKFGADTTQFTKGLDRMNKKTKSTAASIKGSMAKMFAGGIVIAGIRNLSAELDRAGKLAQRFGTSAEKIQKLGVVADLNGTNFEKMARAITDANRAVEEGAAGSKRQADAMEAMGINAEEFLGMDLDEQLKALSDGFIQADAAGQGFSSAQVLMGGSAKELIPLLRQGSEEITKQADAASAASDKTVDRVQKMNDMWTTAKNKVFGWGIAVIETLSKTMPIFVRVKDEIQSTINLALETGIALVGGLIKAFKAILDLDLAAYKDAYHNILMDVGKAVEDRFKATGEHHKKMSESLAANYLKSQMEARDKIDKRDESRNKREIAGRQRVEALKAAKAEEEEAKRRGTTPKQAPKAVKRGQAISSLATHGGGRGFVGAMSGLTRAALDRNKMLATIAENTKNLQTGYA